jgi:hypothetical protein
MRGNLLEIIPGLRAAVEAETLVRDAAFYPVTENVGGFECRPMNLRDFMILRTTKNPLLFNETPSPEELAAFLWLLSPSYNAQGHGKKKFLRKCRKAFMPPMYLALWNTKRARARHYLRWEKKDAALARLIKAAQDYMAETFQDRPPVKATLIGGYEAQYFSDAAGLCATLAREFHYSQEEVLSMPMKCLFQFLNEMRQHHGSEIPLTNPSGKVRADWLRAVNRRN